MFRLLNVATPFTAFTVRLAIGASTAPAAPVPTLIATATGPLKLVARLPKASRASTTGCAAKAIPARVSPGEVVKASCVAAPALMLNGALGADVSAALVAASV